MMQTNQIRGVGRLMTAMLALILTVPAAAAPQGKEKLKAKEGKEATTSLRIEVSGGEKSDAVDNASVYVKYQHERLLAKDKMIEMNVKTNRDGVANVPSVPRGKVLVQVIAPGWKTFGQWYELASAEQTIKIKLQRPPRWY